MYLGLCNFLSLHRFCLGNYQRNTCRSLCYCTILTRNKAVCFTEFILICSISLVVTVNRSKPSKQYFKRKIEGAEKKRKGGIERGKERDTQVSGAIR